MKPNFRRIPLSAVPNSWNSKTENFLFLFEKIGGAQNLKKCRENFSVFGRKLLQSLRAEAGEALKVEIGIFRKKSSNFVQKAPQFFKIKVFEVGGLGAKRLGIEIVQDFPNVFEIKIQSLLGNSEVRLSEAQSKTKFCKPIFFSFRRRRKCKAIIFIRRRRIAQKRLTIFKYKYVKRKSNQKVFHLRPQVN